MKKYFFTALVVVLGFSTLAFAEYNRAGRVIKTDMPVAGTYTAIGIASYLPCVVSAINCYQQRDMYLSFNSDGSNPIRIPAGATYYDDTLLIEGELYATGTTNGDDVCALIKR